MFIISYRAMRISRYSIFIVISCSTNWLFTFFCDIITDGAAILEPLVDKTEYIEEGENVTLRCIGVGYPPPLVQWRKLNGSLSDRVSSTNMSMSTNEGNVTKVLVDLIFTKASRKDSGVYRCFVSNALNIAVRDITLIVQCA